MIRCSACGNQGEALVARDSAKIGVEIGHSLFVDEGFAFFRAENAVNEIGCVRVGHACVVPTGLPFYNGSYPHVETRG